MPFQWTANCLTGTKILRTVNIYVKNHQDLSALQNIFFEPSSAKHSITQLCAAPTTNEIEY